MRGEEGRALLDAWDHGSMDTGLSGGSLVDVDMMEMVEEAPTIGRTEAGSELRMRGDEGTGIS